MWKIIRSHPSYGQGARVFQTREEAEKYLKSEVVKLDKEDGFNFQLEYLPNKEG